MPDFTLHRHAEWAPQKNTLMGWPDLEGNLQHHPERLVRATQEVSSIAQAAANFQPFTTVVGSERCYDEARVYFAGVDTLFPITLHRIQDTSMDMWLRLWPYICPQTGGGRQARGVDLNCPGTPRTETLAETFLRDLDVERVVVPMVTEGSALETDGDGTLLVTESSMVHEKNPGKSCKDIETKLRQYLGVEKVPWIPGRKDVYCNIDVLALVVRPGIVLLSRAKEAEETERTAVYREALEMLSRATDAKGRPLEIIEVKEQNPELFPPGDPVNGHPVRRYVNFVLVNGGIVVPQFGDPAHDAAAIIAMQRLVGDERRILPVLVEELALLGGGIHRLTQEVPKFP